VFIHNILIDIWIKRNLSGLFMDVFILNVDTSPENLIPSLAAPRLQYLVTFICASTSETCFQQQWHYYVCDNQKREKKSFHSFTKNCISIRTRWDKLGVVAGVLNFQQRGSTTRVTRQFDCSVQHAQKKTL
jgi:hypothetical protein